MKQESPGKRGTGSPTSQGLEPLVWVPEEDSPQDKSLPLEISHKSELFLGPGIGGPLRPQSRRADEPKLIRCVCDIFVTGTTYKPSLCAGTSCSSSLNPPAPGKED